MIHRPALRFSVSALVGVVLLLGPGLPATAQLDPTGDEARELAERYAPIVRIAAQDGECDAEGESFAPMSVDVVLGNEDVTLRQAGVGDPVVTRAPVASDLFDRGPGFFLDFNGLALDPECTYERDFRTYTQDTAPLVYAHVATQADEPGFIAVQYWLYWYYNDWNNKHESDWAFIQILFEADDVGEALAESPVQVGYAQHEGGERSSWDDDKLQRINTHPVVYSSRGSHASYFSSSVFLGRKGTEGFGCDTTAEESTELRPEVEVLPHAASSADDEHAWLAFTGRWGERGSGPFNGPTGPNTKPQWDRPIDWQQDLRPASVEIRGGDEANGTILDTFCNVVDFGSNQLRAVQVSPVRQIFVVGLGALALRFLVRSTVWTSTPATPLRRRRHIGQIMRASLASYVNSHGAVLAIALGYLPLAIIVAVIGSATSFVTAQSFAGLFSAVMVPVVTAMIAAYWHLRSEGDERSLVHAFQLVRRRLPKILLASLLAAAIVVALALTIVGIPFAIRQLVRYQFVVPVVTTESTHGGAALRRSSELVPATGGGRHSRWHLWRESVFS